MTTAAAEVEQPVFWQVGGSVRDQLLNKKTKDLDYAVEISSYEALLTWIKKVDGQVIHSKPEFGSVKVRWSSSQNSNEKQHKIYDFTLCRTEGKYTDHRHPTEVHVGTLQQDLSRRDFTINAMARYCLFDSKSNRIITDETKLIDYHNGMQDLQMKIIRCVGNSTDRLKEDALRLLRAMRFSITLQFTLESSIDSALNDISFIKLLTCVSKERIQEEVSKCLEFNTLETLLFISKKPNLQEYLFGKNGLGFILKMKSHGSKISHEIAEVSVPLVDVIVNPTPAVTTQDKNPCVPPGVRTL